MVTAMDCDRGTATDVPQHVCRETAVARASTDDRTVHVRPKGHIVYGTIMVEADREPQVMKPQAIPTDCVTCVQHT